MRQIYQVSAGYALVPGPCSGPPPSCGPTGAPGRPRRPRPERSARLGGGALDIGRHGEQTGGRRCASLQTRARDAHEEVRRVPRR
eukprot:8068604-Pyramimonas_sp.AAC.1